MEITKNGLTEVDEELHRAKEHLIYATTQLERAKATFEKMQACSRCPHVNLEDTGSDIYSQVRCTDCGFVWTD